eukprot:2296593-Lingulodinium_polyedra.AAC.1
MPPTAWGRGRSLGLGGPRSPEPVWPAGRRCPWPASGAGGPRGSPAVYTAPTMASSPRGTSGRRSPPTPG